MSLSLLDNQTRLAPNEFFPQLGGGGGGGGGGSGSFSTVTTSTITSEIVNVSTLVDVAGTGGGVIDVPSILKVDAGGGIILTSSIGITIEPAASAVAVINFLGNDGGIAGLSTINGANVNSYVRGTPANCSLVASAVLPQAGVGGIVPITTGAMSTVAGGRYRVSFNVSDMSPTAGALGLSDHLTFVADATPISTWDLDYLSTIKSGGQPLGWTMSGVFTAAATGSVLGAYQNVTSLQSTILTFGTDSIVNLERLG